MARTTVWWRRWTTGAWTAAAVGACALAGRPAAADPAAEQKEPASLPATKPAEPATRPAEAAKPGGATTKPADATKPADGPGELIRPVGPATAPATRPGTQPADPHAGHQPDAKKAVVVSAEARQLLDRVRDAYQDLRGLRLAGTVTGEFDLNGERQTNQAEFTATFRSAGEFRHQLRERPSPDGAQPVIAADGKADPAAKDKAAGDKPRDAANAAADGSMTVGATGKKLYVYYPRYDYYYLSGLPDRRTGTALGKTVNALLSQQNLSLLLAVVADASAELLDGPDQVEKVADVTVGADACPALRLSVGKELAVTVAFDPKTGFVRRAAFDYRGLAEAKKQQDVKAALVTVDYTLTEPAADPDAAADLKPEAFAWAPPAGARDVTASADGGGGDDDGTPEAAHEELIGKPAPDFKLPGADGVDVRLADLKGNVVLLDFWATWCGPCKESLPHLDEIYQERKDKGLRAYAINLREKPEAVATFVERTKLGLPVLFDKDGKVAKLYGAGGIPQAVVIDKEGKITKIIVSSGTHEQVRAAIDEAMRK